MIVVYFQNAPLLSPNPDGTWSLMADWRVSINTVLLTVPMGFRTDGASIPRFLWRICGHPMEAPRLYLAIIHDWLYSGGVPSVSRAYADAVFRDGLLIFGISRFRAYVEWVALRVCGGTHWQGKTRKETIK